ncbi:MAG: hypothetical protein AMXMBFR59_14050 [Rhodanobacteraceae bacterium]
MDRSLVGTRTDGCGNGRVIASWIFSLAAIAGFCAWPASPAVAADVAVAITVDAAFVEFIRADRRARGIDAPDPAADQRLAHIAARLKDTSVRQTGESGLPASSTVIAVPVERPQPPL